MADFGIAEIAALASLAGTAASVGTGIARSTRGSESPKMPTPAAAAPTDYAAMGKAALPGAKSDAAARGLSGAAPDFMANFIGQQTGEPQAGLSILDELRRGGGG